MSVVQHATLCGKAILLTGDTGRAGLREVAEFAELLGLGVGKVDYFQVPHHGGRRNVDTEILDRWLGGRLAEPLPEGNMNFLATISSASADIHHPRKSVVRAMHHRSAKVITTEDGIKWVYKDAPPREGWVTAKPTPYPEDQEEE
jgi:beta-lactamase superfamily II metal-dependent hydrolase